MMHARRTTAMVLCLVCLALLLLAQDVQSRKLPWAVQEKKSHGSHGTATPEPCSEKGMSNAAAGAKQGQLQRDPTKWVEIHTDYIYTQDVKHP